MILGPPSPCFVEVDEAVEQLQAARGDDRPVVFYWQFDVTQVPRGGIVYNFDLPVIHFDAQQMQAVAKRAAEVWDFSERGVEAWRRAGVEAKHVPLGYHPSMTRFERREPVIDVVFAGSINVRRHTLLSALERRGLTVALAPPVPAQRDELLAAARCSINMLYHPTGVYPMLRAAHLHANRVPFVAERAPECSQDFACRACTDYDRLFEAVVDACENGLEDGFGVFSQRPMVLP